MLYCTIIARRHSLRRGGAKTAGCVMTDRLDWRVAIIGYDRIQWVRYLDAYAQQSGEPEPSMDDGRRKTHLVQYIDDEDDLRRSFYQALLEIKWLPSKFQSAVMSELGLSLQKQKSHVENARTLTLKVLVTKRGCGEMGSGREAAFMMPRWRKSLRGKA